jgi:hypothetical protein
MFPEDADFRTFRTFLGMLQRTNPTVVISTFHSHVTVKFSDQIKNRDETFMTSYTPAEYGSDVTDIIGKVRGYWSTLSDSSKDCLWQYMFVLTELTKRYHSNGNADYN